MAPRRSHPRTQNSARSRGSFGSQSKELRRTSVSVSPKGDLKCCSSFHDISNFCLFLTIVALIGAASATFLIPIVHVRTFLLDVTPTKLKAIREGTLNTFEVKLMHESWPVFNYPHGADLISNLVKNVEGLIAETSEAREIVFRERRRLSVNWRDCFTYYPIVMGLLIFSISAQVFFRLHPFWRNASPITPLFCLAIFHTSISK
ncbi:unnamed protein product [Hydatigera taeniaeformis]|uniref:SSD domain-containing protein n=1 Tax=Hydatigena taeniaeformis TaxID=6205 RepID=A0A0R3X852_HYDTA|nr:unnamed protein product [Hydatigera taeniaeformis]